MGDVHHFIRPITVNVGATLTKVALAERLGRSAGWVTSSQKKGRVRGKTDLGLETWEASYKPGGRLDGYTLLVIAEPTPAETKGAPICAG